MTLLLTKYFAGAFKLQLCVKQHHQMKKLLVTLMGLTFTIYCSGQNKPIDIANDPAGNPIYYSASAPTSNAGLILTIDKSTKWIEYHNTIPNQPLSNFVFLEGTKEIGLFLFVPEDSAKYYRYSIIEDNSRWLYSDATPKQGVKLNNIDKREKIDLGKFSVGDKTLTVEVSKITERNKVATVTIYNKPIKPAELYLTTLGITLKNGMRAINMSNQKDGFTFKIHDTVNVNSILLAIKPSDLTFIYHVYLKKLGSGQNLHISNNWNYGYFRGRNFTVYPDLVIEAPYFTTPGEYEISIIPRLSSSNYAKSFPAMASKIHFTVLKSATTFSKKDLLVWIAIIIIAIGAIAISAIYLNKRTNNNKLLAEQQQRDYAQLQLSAVRSQLNPHFMFNALSGIQNLMNRNEPDQANRYLARFARLTRSVLNNNDLVTLSGEKALLDDYLQMEQLRFCFKYTIDLDTRLDFSNIEIPAMLLQPIVENAVKHGVAKLGEDGIIAIHMAQQDHDLVIFITDSGKGFDPGEAGDGLGLALTKKRMALLNGIYKDATITLDIKSTPSNTTVTVTLSQWV